VGQHGEVTSIDILYLVDRLEAIFTNGQRVPFTHKIMIDDQECYDLLDQIRQVVPEEIRAAKKVTVDRDRITGEAQVEAQRIIQEAEDYREQLLSEEGRLEAAEVRSREIIEEATVDAEALRDGANGYALDVLEALSSRLSDLLDQVQNGIDQLRPEEPAD
jgi:cell division septum initiation protein DivIVA